MKKAIYLLLACMAWPLLSEAQSEQLTQNIRGKVLDANSKYPLVGATIVVEGSEPLLGGQSDPDGYYRINKVPLGRHTLKVQMIGYNPRVIPNVLLMSGKETQIDIQLEESLIESATVEVTASGEGKNPSVAKNEMAFLSARGFSVEETQRYAGARNDPSRMAANFAGVLGNNDSRNDIVIRGNSPTAMLWRFEGADIPNPSHFGALGATGGPVTILNNNVLAQSDFFTGAFPAAYGNAIGGVFDLSMRNGNPDKREFLGQIGFNGFELGAEGPFKKGSKHTYLLNYRYSTIGLVTKVFGLNAGTGAAVPNYQDISFKTAFQLSNTTKLELFGIGGVSDINFLGKDSDSTNFYSNPFQNLKYETSMGVVGANLLHFIDANTSGKLQLSWSGNSVRARADSLSTLNRDIETPQYRDRSNTSKFSLRYFLNKKYNARLTVSAGAFLEALSFSLNDSILYYQQPATIDPNGNRVRYLRPVRSIAGNTSLYQVYTQALYRFSEKLQGTAGLHYQGMGMNNSNAIEPRAGLKYLLSPSTTLSGAYGLHSQMQPIASYFFKQNMGDNVFSETNRNLGYTFSHHYVVGISQALSEKTRLKVETYYQDIFNAPIERTSSSYSMLNEGADFNYPNTGNLVNEGVGRNYGLEITAERNFSNGYYFLATASFFNSEYKGSDQVWRKTAFNSQYITNLLAGKEFSLGNSMILAFDSKVSLAGGRWYTPLNLEESRTQGRAVFQEDQAFSKQFNPYFRWDFKVTFRLNGSKVSQEWFIDIQNLTDNQNPFMMQYNPATQNEVTVFQLGRFPVFNYRLLF